MAIHRLTPAQRPGGGFNPTALPPPPPDSEQEGFGLDQIFAVFRRRRTLIAVITLIGGALAFVAGTMLTAKYTATAGIELSVRNAEDDALGEEAVGDQSIIEGIQTEIELIRSGSHLRRVMAEQGLFDDPAYQPSGGLPGPLAAIVGLLPDSLLNSIGLAEEEPAPSAGSAATEAAALDRFRKKLEVIQKPESRIIDVNFTSADPARAAELANAVANSYIDFRLDLKRERSRQAEQYLGQTVEELRAEVEDVERRLEQYRAEKGLGSTEEGGSEANQRLIELNAQLSTVQIQLDDARAQLQQFEQSGAGVDSAILAQLRGEEARLSREIAQGQGIYGPNHPEMVRLNAELQEVRGNIGAERANLEGSLSSRVNALESREQRILSEREQLLEQRNLERQDAVQLRELERQAEAKRTLYQQLLGRYRETQERSELTAPDARLISRATPPQDASTPPPFVFGLVGFVVSFMFGSMLAFLRDRLDQRVQSAAQIERSLGLSVLGLLPKLSNRRATRWPGRYIAERPFSSFAEAARSIVTGLRTNRHGSSAPVMMVTSALPHEGKTTLAISLAAAAASSGLKTLLIDLDLRCPSLDDRLADTIELPGLVDHLRGQLQRNQLVHHDEGSGIDYVVVGEPPHNPLELLQSPQLRHLIETWRREYDQVFIDSAPILAVTDTRVAASLADRVLVAALWQKTDVGAVSHAIKSLLDVNAEIAGVVMTAVNMKKYKLYAQGEAGSYYKRYRRYYLE